MHVGFKENRRTDLFFGNKSTFLCHYHIQVSLSYFACIGSVPLEHRHCHVGHVSEDINIDIKILEIAV